MSNVRQVVLCIVLVGGGCATTDDDLGSKSAAVLGGTVDPASSLENSTVVLAGRLDTGEVLGSPSLGVLVTPTRVLTNAPAVVHIAAFDEQLFVGFGSTFHGGDTTDDFDLARDFLDCVAQGSDHVSSVRCEDAIVLPSGRTGPLVRGGLALVSIDRVYPRRAAVGTDLVALPQRIDPRPLYFGLPPGATAPSD